MRATSEQMDAKRPQGFRMWWLGQSGFLIQYQARHLLLDPYLSDSLTRKYAESDKPHVRMTEIAVSPERLDFIDLITSSHNHTDHLDADTILPILAASPTAKLLVGAANLEFAMDRLPENHQRIVSLSQDQPLEFGPFQLTGVPASHPDLQQDEEGNFRCIGLIIRFGPWTIYHSGDTMLYEGMESLLKPFGIDVALLPINGNLPERRVAGNLWGDEAARLAQQIGARLVIPCHYEMFEFNSVSPALFTNTCTEIGQAFTVLCCGQMWQSDLLMELD
jgi:L-ascorbate metabolism protein UlaG (beta-lactamase superfamily)